MFIVFVNNRDYGYGYGIIVKILKEFSNQQCVLRETQNLAVIEHENHSTMCRACDQKECPSFVVMQKSFDDGALLA